MILWDHTYFHSKLRMMREDRHLTQEQLAVVCGFQPALISHYETGNRAPGIQNLVKLANALAVSPEEFFKP